MRAHPSDGPWRAHGAGQVIRLDRRRVRPLPAKAYQRGGGVAATRKVDRALDLGAGTGALSRLLQWRATWVAAVEPDPRMWAVLARRLRQGLVGLAGTYSRVLALPAEQRERAMGATRRAVAGLADNPHAPVALPTRCRCLRAVRQ